MELRAPARLNRDAAPAAVCDAYLGALALAGEERAAIVRACASGAADVVGAMRCVHGALAGAAVDAAHPAFASVRARLALGGVDNHAATLVEDDPRRGLRLISAPPIRRTSMVPRAVAARRGISVPEAKTPAFAREPADDRSAPERRRWQRAATIRRVVLFALIVAQTSSRPISWRPCCRITDVSRSRSRILVLFAILFALGLGRFLDGDGRVRRAASRTRPLRDLGARRARHADRRPLRAPRS